MSTEDVVEALVHVLSPYVGETMARASARAQMQKLRLDAAELDAGGAQARALVEKLGQGLNVFVGRARAAAAVEAMKQSLAARAAGA
jgi:hypothetical protein